MFVAQLYVDPSEPHFACFGNRIGAAQKNTLNLSFNINPYFGLQQKAEKATAPSPFQFVMPVSRTQALHLLNPG